MPLQKIIFLLTAYKYFFLFPALVVEGPIITVIAGFLSSLGVLNIFTVYAIAVAGDVVGDGMYYAIGYWGRRKFIERWGRFLGITAERVKNFDEHFEKRSFKTLAIGKLSHVVGAAALTSAGMAKMPFRKFIWYNFIATLPKSLVLALIGFYFGEAYLKIDSYFGYANFTAFLIIISAAVIYLSLKKSKKI
ncbi:MAG: DedA family protein [bacterium]